MAKRWKDLRTQGKLSADDLKRIDTEVAQELREMDMLTHCITCKIELHPSVAQHRTTVAGMTFEDFVPSVKCSCGEEYFDIEDLKEFEYKAVHFFIDKTKVTSMMPDEKIAILRYVRKTLGIKKVDAI